MFRQISSVSKENPFLRLKKTLGLSSNYQYYSLPALSDSRTNELPYSIRILLESALRNCDEFSIKSSDVEKIID